MSPKISGVLCCGYRTRIGVYEKWIFVNANLEYPILVDFDIDECHPAILR